MSGFLLDTNIPSEALRPAPEPNVLDWIKFKSDKEAHFISVISLGELRRGSTLLAPGQRQRQLENFLGTGAALWFGPRVLPITHAIADRWGTISATRQLAGRPLSTADGLIAATALEHGLTLVTRNVKDFASLSVPILNPWQRLAITTVSPPPAIG